MEERYTDRFMNHILPSVGLYDFKDKQKCVNQYVIYMLNRTQSMFKWNGLPDSIPARVLELYLQINGFVCFHEHKGTLYVFYGGLGGMLDEYYRPTVCTVSNPYLNFSKVLEINKECIVFPNDALYYGLIPLFRKYATSLTETDLSMRVALINSRISQIINANDDRTKASADEYINNIIKGDLSVVISEAAEFTGGLTVNPGANTGNRVLTDLIETTQYYKAGWFNEIGLNANYNMKRESINSGESQLNNDALLPLIDDMLNQRRIGAEKVNAFYGTNISVELNSSWQDNQIEIDVEQDALSGQPEDDPVEDRKEPKEGENNEPSEVD